MRRLLLLLALLTVVGCAANPFVVERVNAHLYRFPQPTTLAEWQQVRAALGPGGVVVKLNDQAEGSDDLAAAVGLVDVDLSIEPKGDGPIYAQLEGVFTKPDPGRVIEAVAISCSPVMVGDHCTHGWDRTGFIVAMARVLCDGWTPDAAHEEWHRKAHYVPYGDRVPAPGLEAAWEDFIEMRAVKHTTDLVSAAQGVLDLVSAPTP